MQIRMTLIGGIVALASMVGGAHATTIHWTVQPSLSSMTVTGKVTAFGLTLSISPQGTNGNVSPISGTIDTELSLGGSIDVTASNLSLGISGNWSPLPGGDAGTAPADLGLQGGAVLAVRDTTFSIDTPALTLAGGPSVYMFPANGTLAFAGGYTDYRVTFFSSVLQARTTDFVGDGGPFTSSGGTLSIAGNLATLTIPYLANGVPITVDAANNITGVATLAGTIVATAVVPEPATLVLAGCGAVMLLIARRQRQRSDTKNRTRLATLDLPRRPLT